MSEAKSVCLECSRPPGGHHSPECPKRIADQRHRLTSKFHKRAQRIGMRRFSDEAVKMRIAMAIQAREAKRRIEVVEHMDEFLDEREKVAGQGKDGEESGACSST